MVPLTLKNLKIGDTFVLFSYKTDWHDAYVLRSIDSKGNYNVSRVGIIGDENIIPYSDMVSAFSYYEPFLYKRYLKDTELARFMNEGRYEVKEDGNILVTYE